MDDLEKDEVAKIAKIRRDAEVLQNLIAQPGWKVLQELVEQVGQNFYKNLMTPLSNALESVASEYAKGTLNGLQLAMTLPRSKIEESQSLRNPSSEEE